MKSTIKQQQKEHREKKRQTILEQYQDYHLRM